jgi:hypothetical protein
MRRARVIAKLRDNEAAIRALGVEALFLYGSHARDEAGPDSDVDVFIDRDVNAELGFLEFTGLLLLLEDLLATEVDVSTRASLHPRLRKNVEQGAIRVL